jgi:DNA-binding PadR family transcriptional regulator
MDERDLLLLGMLKMQSQHGYQINDFIEKNLNRIMDMKKATAYAVLDRLSRAGCIAEHQEQEGNRPPRKVYSITPDGERQFLELLRANLSGAEPLSPAASIGLMFIAELPRAEVLQRLEQRLARIDERIALLRSARSTSTTSAPIWPLIGCEPCCAQNGTG